MLFPTCREYVLNNLVNDVASNSTGQLRPVLIYDKKIGSLNHRIALKFYRHLADVPVKFQSDRTILNTNLKVSKLCEILQKVVLSDVEQGSVVSKTER